ncbi:MAG: GNAT family N-acetyltransferase [Solirubrobacterales bacterium]
MSGFTYAGPIETERLVLRAFEAIDLDAVHAMRSLPEVARWTYWEPETREQARASLERRTRLRAIRDEGDAIALAAIAKATGELVGDVVMEWLSREHALAEIGFIVHPSHQGRGYATEMTRPLLRIAFEEVGLHRVIGRAEVRNGASARVMEKLGMRHEAHLVENEWVKGEWQSELVYAILDREWREHADT